MLARVKRLILHFHKSPKATYNVCAVLLDSEKRSDRDLMLTSQEFFVAEELLAILEPFNDATEVVSGEKYPTIGILLPVLH